MKYPPAHLTPFPAVTPSPTAFSDPPSLVTLSDRETVKRRRLNSLRTLKLSCANFSHRHPLFSIACALFDKNTRGGVCTDSHAPRITGHESRPTGLRVSRITSHESPVTSHLCALPASVAKNPPQLHHFAAPATTFRIHTYASVDSKQLYLPSKSTHTKKPGEGGGGRVYFVTRRFRRSVP